MLMKTLLKTFTRKAWILLPIIIISCTEIECPMDNIVMMGAGLYDSETKKKINISENLSITPVGKDTILLNQAQHINEFFLSLKHETHEDHFLLHFSNAKGEYGVDTLKVGHTATPHLESLDCPATYFHTINSVGWSSHPLSEIPLTIDSVEISHPNVKYENQENIKIYLRSVSH